MLIELITQEYASGDTVKIFFCKVGEDEAWIIFGYILFTTFNQLISNQIHGVWASKVIVFHKYVAWNFVDIEFILLTSQDKVFELDKSNEWLTTFESAIKVIVSQAEKSLFNVNELFWGCAETQVWTFDVLIDEVINKFHHVNGVHGIFDEILIVCKVGFKISAKIFVFKVEVEFIWLTNQDK